MGDIVGHSIFFFLACGCLLPAFTIFNSVDDYGVLLDNFLGDGCKGYNDNVVWCDGHNKTVPVFFNGTQDDQCPAAAIAGGKASMLFIFGYYFTNLAIYVPLMRYRSLVTSPPAMLLAWICLAVTLSAVVAVMLLEPAEPIIFSVAVAGCLIVGALAGYINGATFALAARLDGKYTHYAMMGISLAPILSSALKIGLKAGLESPEVVTIVFWSFSIAYTLLCLCLFIYFLRSPLSRKCFNEPMVEVSAHAPLLNADVVPIVKYSGVQVARMYAGRFAVIFLTFSSSTSIFALQFRWVTQNPAMWPTTDCHLDPFWFNIFVVFVWNFGDITGRFLVKLGIPFSHRTLWVAALGRLLFVPLFVLSTPFPDQDAPKLWLLRSDALCFVLAFCAACSNGYVGTVGMIFASDGVPERDLDVVGMLASLALVGGLCGGSALNTFVMVPAMEALTGGDAALL